MSNAWADAAQYGLPALAVIVSGWFAHQGTRKAHTIGLASAQSAKDEAAAEMRQAVAAEREQASADWARYVDAKDRELESLRRQIQANADRIDTAELRALADKERAERSDRLYWKAIVLLRALYRWLNDEHPGEAYPKPPPELDLDL